MEQSSLPTEIILTHPQQSLGNIYLDWLPQPGAYLDLEGQTYAVLERRHRYQLRAGQYHLYKVALYVQTAQRPAERSLANGLWVLGDVNCRFNAGSELLRCAVNPLGPCDRCRFFEKRTRVD
ncbi:MAG TPA: DUF6464 family protein [Candidatus Caenarcaniphilales bacterium]|jgi:hypothetical protein